MLFFGLLLGTNSVAGMALAIEKKAQFSLIVEHKVFLAAYDGTCLMMGQVE